MANWKTRQDHHIATLERVCAENKTLQADRTKLCKKIDQLTTKVIRYQEALIQLRDWDWFDHPNDSMHDVKKIAEKALQLRRLK